MLEWESLSVDLLPHPDMFSDEKLADTKTKNSDDDGAKRMFFGGERFLDNISGEAHVCTVLKLFHSQGTLRKET
mgnify:CR=1 FL=1